MKLSPKRSRRVRMADLHHIGNEASPLRAKLPLPPEILELIFWHMDETTFFISLRTCRQFSEAGSTRKNLLRQVRRLPGLRPGLEDLYGKELRDECHERAINSGCMAWVLADIRTCKLPSGTVLSRSAFSTNSSAKGCWNHSKGSQLALANADGTVSIYSLVDRDVKPTVTLDLHNPCNPKRPIRIGALAFSPKGDLVVLHEQGENVCDHDHKGRYHYNVPQCAPQHTCRIREIYELTTFYRCNDTERDAVSCQRECRRSRVLALEGAKPIGLALACNGNVSIAWKVAHSKAGRHYRVELVRTSKKPAMDVISASTDMQDAVDSSYSQNTTTTFDPFPENPSFCAFIRMNFVENDRKVLLHNAAIPVHNFWKGCDRGVDSQPCYSSSSRVKINGRDGFASLFSVGTPFHGTHSAGVTVPHEPDLVCVKSYLALGLLDVGNQQPGDSVRHLYILHHDETTRPATCKHSVNLDKDLRAQWAPVALLAGWRQSEGTMGSLLETTPGCNRIASAAWDRVLVWTIDPEQLHQGGLAHYFPPRDYNARKGFGRIRPVLLPPHGVVHAMKWINDAELFALTDRGLITWYVGPLASGARRIDRALSKDLTSRTDEWRGALKRVLERATQRATEAANNDLALAFQELYWASLHNPPLTQLLEALMAGDPTPEQVQEFQDYFKTVNDIKHAAIDMLSNSDASSLESGSPLQENMTEMINAGV